MISRGKHGFTWTQWPFPEYAFKFSSGNSWGVERVRNSYHRMLCVSDFPLRSILAWISRPTLKKTHYFPTEKCSGLTWIYFPPCIFIYFVSSNENINNFTVWINFLPALHYWVFIMYHLFDNKTEPN